MEMMKLRSQKIASLVVGAIFCATVIFAPANKAEAVIWPAIPWVVKAIAAKVFTAKVIGTTVAIATIAGGVHAAIELAEKAGYTPLSTPGNEERIRQGLESSIREELRKSPLRYCLDTSGKRWWVSEDINFCPYDGSRPRAEHHFYFEHDSGNSTVTIK